MIFGKILSSRSTTIALPSPITCIKKPPDSLTKFEKQKNYSSRLYKKSGKNISKVLIQERPVTIKIFGKIYNLFSLENERLAIR